MNFFKSYASFWGVVSAATVAFPLLNNLFLLLPLIEVHTALQTTLASVVSIYALALGYSLRIWFPKKTLLASVIYLTLSIACLTGYLYLFGFAGSYNPAKISGLIVLYILFCFFITLAFSMLAVHEFMVSVYEKTNTEVSS